MIRFIFAITALLGASLIVGATTLGTALSALEVAEVHDWGTMRPPKSGYLETDLKIRNRAAEGELSILEVKPGCGCTTAEPVRRLLGPGEETTVHVKLNISPTQNGLLQRNVTFRSVHGSDTTTQTMWLKVDVARLVTVGPSGFVAINGAKVGVVSEAVVTIMNPGDAPVTIDNVKPEEGLLVDLPNDVVLGPKESRQLLLKYTPVKSGTFQSNVRFTARVKDESDEIQIPAYGTTIN
ncbi:MAG: DUF1573 domain-containing protein [Candidatus Kapabacteria bacterium]|nr:DUF1573 domain-containing protein [Candidatus Kapabacteria bacterium]